MRGWELGLAIAVTLVVVVMVVLMFLLILKQAGKELGDAVGGDGTSCCSCRSGCSCCLS